MTTLYPNQPVPDLSIPTLDGIPWRLSENKGELLTMIIFYRGFHCPICGDYLSDLDDKISKFEKLGVNTIAISCDSKERAEKSHQKWKLKHVKMGYDLTIDQAVEWGLFISAGRGGTKAGVDEPNRFCEPGVFFIKPSGELYGSIINTFPFARPRIKDLLSALETIKEKDYAPRGEVLINREYIAATP